MPNKWDLNYKPDKGDRTGVNLILKHLKDASFVTQDGVTISKKRVPTDMRGFAKLNPPEQAHLLAQIFKMARKENGQLMYNKSLWQYACQIQRYFRKLYKSQYMKLSPKQQMRTIPRTFNLTDAVYAKAGLALDQQMSKSVRDGIKSTATIFDTLQPKDVVSIFGQSDPKNSTHVTECAFIAAGVSRAFRAVQENYETTQSDLWVEMEDGKPVLKFNPLYSKTYKGDRSTMNRSRDATTIRDYSEFAKDPKHCPKFWLDRMIELTPEEIRNKGDAKLWRKGLKIKDGIGYGKQHLGEKAIGKIVENATHRCDIKGRFSNKSLRQLPITSLFRMKAQKHEAQGYSGHMSDAILDYNQAKKDKQKELEQKVNSSSRLR